MFKDMKKGSLKSTIDTRLAEFKLFESKQNSSWFSELCFCLLTANSKAKTAIAIQKELGFKGFFNLSQEKIAFVIKKNGHRFHNNKSKYIVGARQYKNIKDIITTIVDKNGVLEAREWLVSNVKGLGYKESSHFLRNVGYTSVSILDRHILNWMNDNDMIIRPKSLNKKSYMEIENKFNELAKKNHMTSAELDLYMWYVKTGEILK